MKYKYDVKRWQEQMTIYKHTYSRLQLSRQSITVQVDSIPSRISLRSIYHEKLGSPTMFLQAQCVSLSQRITLVNHIEQNFFLRFFLLCTHMILAQLPHVHNFHFSQSVSLSRSLVKEVLLFFKSYWASGPAGFAGLTYYVTACILEQITPANTEMLTVANCIYEGKQYVIIFMFKQIN